MEDDASLRAALRYHLGAEGYEVLTAADGREALLAARDQSPDLIVLDLMLPIMSGLDICRAIRNDGNTVPILMLTAKESEVDRVVGLEVGADDYVTKPFSTRELMARVAAMLRRVDMLSSVQAKPPDETLTFGHLTIDLAAREVFWDGDRIPVRPKEFELLSFLAQNPGRAFTRDQLLQHIWGYEYSGDTRTVDVHVRWLRQKVEEDPSTPHHILTVRGIGYRFAP